VTSDTREPGPQAPSESRQLAVDRSCRGWNRSRTGARIGTGPGSTLPVAPPSRRLGLSSEALLRMAYQSRTVVYHSRAFR
jgi:hypothetical protein